MNLCECGCGQLTRKRFVHGHNGRVTSRTHGATVGAKTPEYRAWLGMKKRCFRKTDQDYPNYGGRGIGVCGAWVSHFENFLNDMGPRPSPDHSIDRRDNNGHYEPENCRWATATEQSRNRSVSRHITVNGVTRTPKEWAAEIGIGYHSLMARINRLGMSPEDAVTMPKGGKSPAAGYWR
jgi:hypothetical protein